MLTTFIFPQVCAHYH
ncbi:Protein CBG25961 [Caenorhabditis briggsae]|uniref:Protein CBG25961 n=1 Tax=Caenorhabditis briggsae TaxID=6238 RepID=B6IKR1_CAEBR|nr:Protein CBG25961 [Caenorhabditis briggsae]CAS00491.1 Protein CBG25961 [Caenorhabditis briggsae]